MPLEPWIIEEILRKEREERRRKEEREQPRIDIPEMDPDAQRRWEDEEKRKREQKEKDEPKRGVVIIET